MPANMPSTRRIVSGNEAKVQIKGTRESLQQFRVAMPQTLDHGVDILQCVVTLRQERLEAPCQTVLAIV